jgi:hypothetical protein
MKVQHLTLLTAGDMSQATLTTASQQVDLAFGFSVQAIATGAPVGALKLQISLDGTNFVDYPSSSQAVSAAGSFIWNVADVMFRYFRVVYTKTSGTGSLTILEMYKGI